MYAPNRVNALQLQTVELLTVKPPDQITELRASLNRREIPALNGIRAVSVIAVMLYHFDVKWGSGHYGVMFFFVLSGFLITHLLLKENAKTGTISIRDFYIRRSLRIFPAFYVFLAVYITALLLVRKPVLWDQMLASATYVRNYFEALWHREPTQAMHTWSLAVEEQFYLLWPFLFVRLRKNLPLLLKYLVAFIAVVWIYRGILSFLGLGKNYIYYAFDTRADALAIGCAMSIAIVLGKSQLGPVISRIWIGAAAMAAVIGFRVATEMGIPHFNAVIVNSVVPVLFAILIVSAIRFHESPLYSWLDHPLMRFTGVISYPLYLYHVLADNVANRLPEWLRLPAEFAVSFALATLSYYCVERYFLRLKDRVFSKPAAVAAGA